MAQISALVSLKKANNMAVSLHPSSLARRARTEAYVGLFILLIGATGLAFTRCSGERKAGHTLRVSGTPPRSGKGSLPDNVAYGSAPDDGEGHRGWWIGHFIAAGTMRHTSAVETKWAVHSAGKKHDGFSTNKIATSMAILISGKHRLEFERSYVVLENAGDYVIWGAGVAHSWTALEDSTVLCVRWPSVLDDQGEDFRSHNSSGGSNVAHVGYDGEWIRDVSAKEDKAKEANAIVAGDDGKATGAVNGLEVARTALNGRKHA